MPSSEARAGAAEAPGVLMCIPVRFFEYFPVHCVLFVCATRNAVLQMFSGCLVSQQPSRCGRYLLLAMGSTGGLRLSWWAYLGVPILQLSCQAVSDCVFKKG